MHQKTEGRIKWGNPKTEMQNIVDLKRKLITS
jgi:hypothetical protein